MTGVAVNLGCPRFARIKKVAVWLTAVDREPSTATKVNCTPIVVK
jgi:hypothetical protein